MKFQANCSSDIPLEYIQDQITYRNQEHWWTLQPSKELKTSHFRSKGRQEGHYLSHQDDGVLRKGFNRHFYKILTRYYINAVFFSNQLQKPKFEKHEQKEIVQLTLLRALFPLNQKSREPSYWEVTDCLVLLAKASLTNSKTIKNFHLLITLMHLYNSIPQISG